MIRLLILSSLGGTVALVPACTSGKRAIEAPPDAARQPVGSGGGHGDDTWGGRDAVLVARLPPDIVLYVDPNARLDFALTYLTVDTSGQVTFSGGVGELTVENLPSGETGDLKLELYQGGALELEGTKQGVTLKSGANRLSMDLTEAGNTDGGGGSGGGDGSGDADLVLDLNIKPDDGGGDTENSFRTTILPLSQKYCVACHQNASLSVPDNEDYWRSRKAGLTQRLTSNNMPQAGSEEARTMTDAERRTLLDYLAGL